MDYQAQLDGILEKNRQRPLGRLLLHACCAPCSSYVLEYLHSHFDITVFFYNPNIAPEGEYYRRLEELRRFMQTFAPAKDMPLIEAEYATEVFRAVCAPRAGQREGESACFDCYSLRLRKAAQYAAGEGYDYFTTTLSISPHKNAGAINAAGQALAKEYGVAFLPSDFKKRGGFVRSVALGKEYGLYRQEYCGCSWSMAEAQARTR